ncbi:hypothetical protein RHSIM_Rhsim10G0081700 [Rhododendron simsii]|uniref:Hydroxyproline-rich glycoprotein family protein n=1 Tax=Rhododendron simsii TaxID=118357 RepID=A0A834GCW8_RHOSS|nr:hypothetical protein RHSIM_Rhsim10G0081700 [Rhododendron simsii]
MESSSYAPPRPMDASRPSIGFPLGTALLLIVIFSLSGVFSCCYHWEKIRSLRRSMSGDPDLEADSHDPPSKPTSPYMNSYGNKSQSLPVLMPGDHIPKFIALPCPREPPRPEKIIVEVRRTLPKPPRIAVPLY